MSEWSVIAQVVVVRSDGMFAEELSAPPDEPHFTQEQMDDAVEEAVRRCIMITGSEGPAFVFVNKGRETTGLPVLGDDGSFIGHDDYVTEYIVTVQGYLRDRTKERTEAEWRESLGRLDKEFGEDYVDLMAGSIS